MLFDPGGAQKGAFWTPLRISVRVRVRMICPCFIEEIGSYVHFLTAKFVPFRETAFQSCAIGKYLCMFVRMDVKSLDIYRGLGPTLDIYRGFRKRSIFTVVFENMQFSVHVKPDLLDIYRRF